MKHYNRKEAHMLTDRDHSTLEISTLSNRDDEDLDIAHRNLEWLDWTKPHEHFDESEVRGTKAISPRKIADAIYNGKRGYLPAYYTDLYEDYPLIVSYELTKRVIKNRQPAYLKEISDTYRFLTLHIPNYRSWYHSMLKFYGPLAVSMLTVYGLVDKALELAVIYPKLLNKEKQPESMVILLKIIDKWHLEGRKNALSQKEIYEGIQKDWISVLNDIYPTLITTWDSLMTFETN